MTLADARRVCFVFSHLQSTKLVPASPYRQHHTLSFPPSHYSTAFSDTTPPKITHQSCSEVRQGDHASKLKMPRPLRSRVASSRTAASTSAPPAAAAQTRSSSADFEGNSNRKTERGRKAKETSTIKDSLLERARGNASSHTSEVLEASKQRRDEALSRLENLTSTTSGGDHSEDPASPAVEFGRKAQTATRQRRAPDASGLDVLDDEMFGDLDTSFEDEDSADAHHTTADTSTFNIGVFKRRPHQSSIVGRDDAPIRPSSRGPNTPGLSSTFSLGTFKRRAREPSILLSSAQKESTKESITQQADDTSDDEDEDIFAPEAEGTPARPSKGRPSDASSIRSRKRKSTDAQENEPKRQAVAQEEDDEVHESIEVDDQSSLSSLALDRERYATPVNEDEIMAPPASSGSSNASPTVWPSFRTLRRGRSKRPASRSRNTPVLDDGVSDISSPPSLTHSPNFPARKTRKAKATSKREPTPNFSTADLASLLPRRRQRAGGEDPFGIASSEDEDDSAAVANGDDELSYVASRRSRRPVRPLGGASATNQSTSRHKAKEAQASSKQAKRTYGSRNLSDKENAEEGSIVVGRDDAEPADDTFFDDSEPSGSVPPLSEELKTQGKRFKEVDRWELDYEEVVESSSPARDVVPEEQAAEEQTVEVSD